MDPNYSGYMSPRETQDTNRSIFLVELLPGIREAHSRKKTQHLVIIITELSPFSLHPQTMGIRARTSP